MTQLASSPASPPTAPLAPPAPGTIAGGRWLIAQLLGDGGGVDASVAIDLERGGAVAFTVGAPDAASRARFEREARVGGLLEGAPGLLRAIAAGALEDGRPFLASERVEGAVALDLLDGPLDVRLSRLAAVAERVASVHARGIVHRDLRPAVLLIDPAGEVLLGGLGLALPPRAEGAGAEQDEVSPGELVGGAPAFMPLEQFEDARRADARSDVHALGALLYLVLTGRVPYEGDSKRVLGQLIRDAHGKRGGPRPGAHWSGVPRRLDELCARGMHGQPARRPPNAAVFLAELQEALAELAAGATLPEIAPRPAGSDDPEGALDRTVGVDRTRTSGLPIRRLGDGDTTDRAHGGPRVTALRPFAPRPAALAGETVRLTDREGREAEWEPIEALGRGGLGEAWLVRRRQDGLEAALKLSHDPADLSLEIERRILEQLDHPNVVGLLGRGPGSAMLVERAFPNPLLLLDALDPQVVGRQTRYPPLPPGVALELGFDLLRGIEHLHSLSFCHHDVKVGNFLIAPVSLTPDDCPLGAAGILEGVARSRYRGVLIDLGGARSFAWLDDLNAGRDTGELVPPQLTPALSPPEALLGRPTPRGMQSLLLPSHDLYAAGLTIYMMLTGHFPYHHTGSEIQNFPELFELKELERVGELRPITRDAIERTPMDDVRFVSTDPSARARFVDDMWGFLSSLVGAPDVRPSATQARRTFQDLFQLRGGERDARPRQGIFSMDFAQNRLAAAAARAGGEL